MDLIETLRSTGAVRDFLPDPIDDAVLYRILDTARFAPSGQGSGETPRPA
jgi:nitroreductase